MGKSVGLLVGVLVASTLGAAACKRPPAEFAPPPPPEVTVALPVVRTIEQTMEFAGRTRGFEEIELRARVKGFLDQKLTSGGRRVKVGEALFSIDRREYQAVVDQGQLVGAGDATLLASVINDSKVFASFQIDERTVLALRRQYQNRRPGEDGRANLQLRPQLPGEQGFPHEGIFENPEGEIRSGLKADERVIVNGTQRVRVGAKANAKNATPSAATPST